MAWKTLTTAPVVRKTGGAPAPAVAEPAEGEAADAEPRPEQAGHAVPGDVVNSAEQIDALMAEKRQARPVPAGVRERRPPRGPDHPQRARGPLRFSAPRGPCSVFHLPFTNLLFVKVAQFLSLNFCNYFSASFRSIHAKKPPKIAPGRLSA